MSIHPAPLKSRPSIIADWVEIKTIANENSFYRLNQLKRFWDTHRETEDSDPAGQQRTEDDTDLEGVSGADDDAFLDAITDEISQRASALGDAYPFQFDLQGMKLRFRSDVSEAGYIYMFCLLLTHCNSGEVLNGRWLPSVDNNVRDLFQACSTLAAAGVVDGCAISFGWPRRHKNRSFLDCLKEVYVQFGEGQVVHKPPRGASPMVKDGEIDVIAWKPREDNAAGTFYLLGQVASGANWEAKSIKGGSIDSFHHTWFTRAPASTPIPAIFIPLVILSEGGGNRRETVDLLTAKFGNIYDRLILPAKAKKGILLADDTSNSYIIERRSDIPKITEWVVNQVTGLRHSLSNMAQ